MLEYDKTRITQGGIKVNKKLYISPEFEWLEIDLIDDVLSASNPDIVDDTYDGGDGSGLIGDDDEYAGGTGGDSGGTGGGTGGGDAGNEWW